MKNTTYILEKIKIEGEFRDIIAKSNGKNVSVTWNGATTTLASALASIYSSLVGVSSGAGADVEDYVDGKISDAINELINGAPETYDTLKEIADYIASHEETASALNAAIGNKVDKADGKGLSTEDFTTALKTALENLDALGLTAERIAAWDNKAEKTTATTSAAGLMSAADKLRLDNLRGVRYGTSVPDDMLEGELFVRVVEEEDMENPAPGADEDPDAGQE